MTARHEVVAVCKPHIRRKDGNWWVFQRAPRLGARLRPQIRHRIGNGVTIAIAWQRFESSPHYVTLT